MISLQTLWGPLELRRRQGGEANVVGLHLCESEVTRALARAAARTPADVVALAHEMSIWNPMLNADLLDLQTGLLKALKAGRLVVAKPGEGGVTDAEGALWTAFETFRGHFGREFNIQMRVHRLTTRETAAELRREQDYDIVPAAEASGIVLRLGQTAGVGPVQAAGKMLADNMLDLRSPPAKQGFVLVRAPMAYAARYLPLEEVVTPAKLKELAAKDWIEIHLSDEEGAPLSGTFKVVLPGGESRDLLVAEKGFVRIDGILSGTCELRATAGEVVGRS